MIINRPDRTIQFTRRGLLKTGLATAGAAAIGAKLSAFTEALVAPVPASAATAFIKGCDVSFLNAMEGEGYTFKNSSGQTEDLFTILKGYDINCIRLRSFVNPSNDPIDGMCTTADTYMVAARAKAAGMKVLIDFHFGDTFNSVGGQTPPAAWANYDYSQMLNAVYGYVYNYWEVFKYNHVTADYVQLGNEINSGLLHPIGELSKSPSQMTNLIMAAREESLNANSAIKIIIHLAQPQNTSAVYAMLDAYKSNGGEWDITGLSSYGSGSEVAGIVGDMHSIQSRYNKPVMQVEFGGKYTNPSGVKTDLSNYITGVRNFGGLGVFYFEPEIYPPFNASYPMGAWDPNSKEPTAAMQGFYS